jgi:2-phospho-L-lactate guanylyltransferase
MTHTGVVIPIRSFAMGKARLADTLDVGARADLGRRCADQVAAAAAGLPTIVVSSDPEVRDWASARTVTVLEDPGTLNGAAAAGRAALRDQGCTRVVVAHADLPRARTFATVVRDGSLPVVVVVPCHRDDGTPVLSVPAGADFRFAYGPGSARRHAAEGRRLGLGVRVVRDPLLGFDVDVPADLLELAPDQLARARAR